MPHYNFIEIGTSDFATLIQKATPDEIGISVDAVQEYLDKLPSKPGVSKLCAAISAEDGVATMYYIPLETILSMGLPKWMRGTNCLGSPHPTVLKYLDKANIPASIISTFDIPVIGIASLLTRYHATGIDYLKIDTEGHDTVIMNAYLDHCADHPAHLASRIRFESNALSCSEEVAAVKVRLVSLGYTVSNTKTDTIATR